MRDLVLGITPYLLAERFFGMSEIVGVTHNPAIVAMLQLDATWVHDDETPWCSAFVNYVCYLLGLPRSKSLAARSWLKVGRVVDPVTDAAIGFDVVVLQRGSGPQPGPDVISAPGHVGFYAGGSQDHIDVLGGNQGNSVSVAEFGVDKVLGIRRLVL